MKTSIKKANILVVDDMATNRRLVESLLQDKNYNFTESSGGIDALEKIKANNFDAVLLDILMPDLDGFGVLTEIRKNSKLQLLPVIIVTTLDTPEDIARGLELGATDYVTKPFNPIELGARVSSAIEKKRLTDRLDNAEAVLYSLALMVEARDKNTGDHCARLSHMAVVFGKELGLDYEQLEALSRGGVLHDIGKLGIPDNILLKKGKLDVQEWEIMKQHTTIGASLCRPLRSMQATIDIVLYHHEKWNGSGYPIGLSGEDIPFLARVFQIVDIYDALSTERPYKPALPVEKIRKIFLEESEKGFWDSQLVEQFLDILDNRPESLVLGEDTIDLKEQPVDDLLNSGVIDWYHNIT